MESELDVSYLTEMMSASLQLLLESGQLQALDLNSSSQVWYLQFWNKTLIYKKYNLVTQTNSNNQNIIKHLYIVLFRMGTLLGQVFLSFSTESLSVLPLLDLYH